MKERLLQRLPREQSVETPVVDETCDHVWTHYVERLKSERRSPAEIKRTGDMSQLPIAAYFRTKQCETCQMKIRTNYKVGGIKVAEGTEVRDFVA